MPKVRYLNKDEGIDIQKSMAIPKKMARPEAWLQQARRTIPEIPSEEYFFLEQSIITVETIIFEMVHRVSRRKCVVIIDRNASSVCM
jgi:hypothetical protein